ncbi:hypothetical protein [Vallitalea maricola]|uniref:Uncharacterized protein n=1 Tax=Vallitalea maricola TaxID=3074433 RepID=A0ACB5UNX1_9FIRM|nr:hypothetical protein AN2V17_37820 [Vallitalea sp. AN17-2]
MKKLIIITCLVFLALVGCHNNGEEKSDITQVDKGINENQSLEDNNLDNKKLNSNIEDLLSSEGVKLKISQDNSEFFPASEEFTNKVIELISRHGNSIWRDTNTDNYDVILRCDGFKDIHMNLECGSFWFEDSEELYISPVADRWNNYIIKIINGKPMYSSFKKTILGKIQLQNSMDEAVLFYDGDVRLQVNNYDILIDDYLSESDLFREHNPVKYELININNEDLFLLTRNSYDRNGKVINQYLYKYENEKIENIWSTDSIDCDVEYIDVNKKSLYINFPFINEKYQIKLTQDEIKEVKRLKEQLESEGIIVDENFYKNTSDNLICVPRQSQIKDIDNNDINELVITIQFDNVGMTMSPIPSMNAKAIIVFNIQDNNIVFSNIIFERDNVNKDLDYLFKSNQ